MDIELIRRQLEAADRLLDTACSQTHKRVEKIQDAREFLQFAIDGLSKEAPSSAPADPDRHIPYSEDLHGERIAKLMDEHWS